jgi:hypothetical protein
LEIQRIFISEVAMNAKIWSHARDEDFSNAFTLVDNALYYGLELVGTCSIFFPFFYTKKK